MSFRAITAQKPSEEGPVLQHPISNATTMGLGCRAEFCPGRLPWGDGKRGHKTGTQGRGRELQDSEPDHPPKYPPPPRCNSYALVQATAGNGTVLIWYLI